MKRLEKKEGTLFVKFNKIFCFLSCLALLTGCQRNGSTVIRHYLSYKYKLEDCADIHGQNNYSKIWFSEYNGDSFKSYFDLGKSYLDMRVIVVDKRAKGVGEISLARLDDESKSINQKFEYYTTLTDTTGGKVTSTLSDKYTDFVFCIYWCRVNLKFENPISGDKIVLTLHFRGGQPNEYPSEFDR